MTMASEAYQSEDVIEVIPLTLTADERRLGIERGEAIHWGGTTLVKFVRRNYEAVGTYSSGVHSSDEVRVSMARSYALRRLEQPRVGPR